MIKHLIPCSQIFDLTQVDISHNDCRGSTVVSCVGPGESCLYTWENPLEKRLLFWSAGMEADTKDELIKVRNWENLNADTQILFRYLDTKKL